MKLITNLQELIGNNDRILYIAAKDGYYEVHQTPVGIFSVKTVPEKLPTWKEGFHLSLPKIPVSVLGQIIAFFRHYCVLRKEVYARIYWDEEKGNYVAHVPRQIVTSTSVVYEADERDLEIGMNVHMIPVMDIHSHHAMKAFWSYTDDCDEVATQLYAVVGWLDIPNPELLVRFGVRGKHRSIDPSAVFEEGYEKAYQWTDFPAEWTKRVEVKVNEYGDDTEWQAGSF